jgi:DNA topoisomerase-1
VRLATSDPHRPGYRRLRHGRGFRYVDEQGRTLRDPATLERIRSLVIPPAWREVWICPRANGHLQAVGTDAAGRRQYLYHPEFRRKQEEAKHRHVLEIAASLPAVRKRTEAHMGTRGLNRDRVLACAVRLLDLGFFRVGSDAYTRDNGTYGLTTMLREHVTCGRGEVTFDFPAKGGNRRVQAVADPLTCSAVTALRRRRGGGERLFAYWAGKDWHDVHSDDLNACLKELSGLDISAKDFRTWHATVLAAVALAVSVRVARDSEAARKRAVSRAVREVAHYLGNTPAVCRASYINPRVVELYERGITIAPALDALGTEGSWGAPATQGRVEAAVLELLADGG